MTRTMSRLLPFALLWLGCGDGDRHMDDGDHACTAIGCVDGLTVDFQSASGSWQPGDYRISMMADERAIVCTATLPLTMESRSQCSATDVTLGLSGSALPPSAHALSGLMFTSRPAKLSITITRDMTAFAATSFQPDYTTSQPNGPECGPVCTNAGEIMQVP
jgi:hypothetical protein